MQHPGDLVCRCLHLSVGRCSCALEASKHLTPEVLELPNYAAYAAFSALSVFFGRTSISVESKQGNFGIGAAGSESADL